MKKVNTYLIITALLLIILGAVCIVNPVEIFKTMAWLVGLLILLTGIVSLFFWFACTEILAQRWLDNAARRISDFCGSHHALQQCAFRYHHYSGIRHVGHIRRSVARCTFV